MGMEPSEEQLRVVMGACRGAGADPWGSPVADDVWPHIARAAWHAIAPLVRVSTIEECATALPEALDGHLYGDTESESGPGGWRAEAIVARIRSLKDKQP
jgi:hypothetical protein